MSKEQIVKLAKLIVKKYETIDFSKDWQEQTIKDWIKIIEEIK